MKTKAAITNKDFPLRRVCFTAAALLPLLSACSTDDFGSSLFGTSTEQTASMAAPNMSGSNSTVKMDATFNHAACGVFFGQANTTEIKPATNTEISLDRTPQENLMQAIAFDIDGQYESARKLYVWLTASPPENKINLDCGQGVKLSGNVNALAQRRLVALDTTAPQFARSTEIETVVAAATVAPGPDLPDPPHVERDRRFYETGGVVVAEPEDSTKPIERMEMEVSDNTAKLTMVERRNPVEPVPAASTVSTVAMQAETPKQQMTPVVIASTAAPAEQPSMTPVSAPAVSAPTISGASATAEHEGAVVASNSRPTEQGQLEIADREAVPAASMIELPMASKSSTQPVAQRSQAPTTPVKSADIAPKQPSAVNGPYYAVQLAAYRSRERAETAWTTFRASSRGVLNNAPHEVISIAIEGKGLFFRLLTGQYAAKSEATTACGQLKSVGVDCLIRRVTP